ncbi:hypothetical protein SDRG_00679 [Saprolegnia diclina VS20]|uniref:Uncharacterized protein n=1 Tax=Saprolegnia diclina (strain VS20) TaxID=1156394 RepID=T0R5W3_SAPDV|nr:hypothetical protein SDRG_00679 [Saprolegnia diclina VS20]EQC41820.1 hypothetical protein SDRG_00679 [Saprolegnia diclina VS20]|eukprot:XP_008604389.1 hypothetical protein SDRG_00679 [Saprolegnia diclina VS20]
MSLAWRTDAQERGLAACLRQRDDNAHQTPTRIGEGGNILQRGTAVYLRQRDINSCPRRLTLDDRQFLDRVIHDASLSHSSDCDGRLAIIVTRLGVQIPLVYCTPTKAAPVQRQEQQQQEQEQRIRERQDRARA